MSESIAPYASVVKIKVLEVTMYVGMTLNDIILWEHRKRYSL